MKKVEGFKDIIFDGDIIHNCECAHCPWEIVLISGAWKLIELEHVLEWNAFQKVLDIQHVMRIKPCRTK